MGNIDKIQLPNGNTYDINDTYKSGIYTVIGTQTAATASWTGALHGVSALYNGLTINYYLPYAGVSSTNVTLNLTLDDGTTTGAKNCYINTSRLTTHYGAGRTIVMTYYSAGSISISGTATTDDRWICDAYYDTNSDTKVRQTLLTSNTNRPLLMSYAQNDSTTTNVDNVVYRNNSIYATPSTGTITALKFSGDLVGNADTATNASAVNGHTVGIDVPSNAKFTDTTYESKTASSGGTDVSLCTTGEKYTWNNKSDLAIGTTSTTALAGDTLYAGSSSAGGSATSAEKLNTNAGSMLNPVYFSNGVPVSSSGNSIPFIIGMGTSAGTWLGTLTDLTAYYDGLLILYKPSVAGASTTTLNLNNLGAKTCYINNTTKLTTHFPKNQPILLVYSSSQNSGCWMCLDDYWTNSNTVPSAYCDTAEDAGAKTATCTAYTAKTNSYLHVLIRYANTKKSALTLNINSQGAKPIYINGVASSSSNYTLPAGTYIVFYDGTNYYFRTDDKIHANITGDAATVGGYTVGKNVPSNAKLTDQYVNQADNADANVDYELLMEDTASSGNVISGTRKTPYLKYHASNATLTIGDITPAGGTLSVTNVSATNINGVTVGSTPEFTDTKNTAGSTDTSSKIYLIGATSQAANPQTYSDNEVYTESGVLSAKSTYARGGSIVLTNTSNNTKVNIFNSTYDRGNIYISDENNVSRVKMFGDGGIVLYASNGTTSNIDLSGSDGKITAKDFSISPTTPTYTMTKTSGTWNVGSVTARRCGNIVQMQVFVKGTGTAVGNGGNGFTGKIAGTYLPAIPTTFVSYISTVVIVCYIDASGNIELRPYGGSYTASSGTNIEADGMFICP